jgi:hypothetical protein
MATLKSDLSHLRVGISIPEMKEINKENINQHFGQAGEQRHTESFRFALRPGSGQAQDAG